MCYRYAKLPPTLDTLEISIDFVSLDVHLHPTANGKDVYTKGLQD